MGLHRIARIVYLVLLALILMKRTLLTLLISVGLLYAAQAQTKIIYYTSMGDFIVEMSDSLTPITSGNFISLVDTGFYDGLIFHRVIEGFVVQGGDPPGAPTGPGYTIPDEFDSTGTLSNVQKTISMANTGQPNTGGSQFFINLVDNTFLDYDKAPLSSQHPVFGMVIDGFDVVLEIGSVEVYSGSKRPVVDVVMDSLRIFDPNDTIDTTPPPPPLGLHELAAKPLKTRIFPNPVLNWSLVTIESPMEGAATIKIVEPLGREISTRQVMLRKGMNRLTAFGSDSQTLLPGVYHLVIEFEDCRNFSKFVVSD